MIKKIILALLLLFLVGCNNKNSFESDNIKTDVSSEVVKNMILFVEGKEFNVNLENNETTKSLINLLPLEVEMTELNGNEKYVYLNSKLPINSYNPKHIEKGDVMLYGNNCLVIFYKSFDTSYSYTKIGHVDNLPELGNNNIRVIIKGE